MVRAMRVPAFIEPFIDVLFPPRCPLCGEALARQGGLCAACWLTLAVPGEPSCELCQRPFPDGTASGTVCAQCLAERPRHDGIAAATLYNDPTRRLILAFKHGHKIALSDLLGRMMVARLPTGANAVGPDWLIVPVPLHRWRLWTRGYNQSALLAGEIARVTGARLVVDGLARIKATPSLATLGRKARSRVLSGAIVPDPRRAELLRGAKVLLVDDVYTSGATSGACVAALKRAGATKVVISCFARVLDEALPFSEAEAMILPEVETKTPGALLRASS